MRDARRHYARVRTPQRSELHELRAAELARGPRSQHKRMSNERVHTDRSADAHAGRGSLMPAQPADAG